MSLLRQHSVTFFDLFLSDGEHLHHFHQTRTDGSQCCQPGCLICTVRVILWHMQRRTWTDFQCLFSTTNSSVKWLVLPNAVFKLQHSSWSPTNHKMIKDRWKKLETNLLYIFLENAENMYWSKTNQNKNKRPFIPLQLMRWKTLHQLKFHRVGLESRIKTADGKAIWKWQENYPFEQIFPCRFDRTRKVHGVCMLRLHFSLHRICSLLDLNSVNKAKNHSNNWKTRYACTCKYSHFLQSKKQLWQCTCILVIEQQTKNAGTATSDLGERFN